MASKQKGVKTYVVHHRGQASHGAYTILGRNRIGAKNEKQGEEFLRKEVGKHVKAKTYYEEKEKLLPFGTIIKEC